MVLSENQIVLHLEKLNTFHWIPIVTPDYLIKWANQVLNVLKFFFPPNGPIITGLENELTNYMSRPLTDKINQNNLFLKYKGFIEATYEDFKQGFLKDFRLGIHAEVESDFLSQAQKLLGDDLKDPAAMLIGAVLEDALRQLCKKNKVGGIKIGSKIGSMNNSLQKAKVFGNSTHKQVIAWAAIRNNADHARFDEYDIKEVKLMCQGVNDFIAKYLE